MLHVPIHYSLKLPSCIAEPRHHQLCFRYRLLCQSSLDLASLTYTPYDYALMV